MKTPCEVSMWYVVPYIRSHLAISMVKDLDLKQAEAARMLGVTNAAVSQYLSGKRGRSTLEDEKITAEIRRSAAKIVGAGDDGVVVTEICRLCKLIAASGLTSKLHDGGCGNCP